MAVYPESYISTFSGIGALDLAIGRVFPTSRCLAYVEGEAYAAAVLAARMETGDLDDAPIWSDIRTFPTDALRGRVDLVVGGFPCQDLSLAGKRAGIDGARSGLYFDLIRIVRDVRPRYVFLENVAAITAGRTLDAVLGALADLGFSAEWGCLKASDVGAPHGRNRWWCLAWDARQLADAGRTAVRQPAECQHEKMGRQQHIGVVGSTLDDPQCRRHGHQDEPLPAGWDCAVVACNDSAVANALRLQRSGRRPEVRDGRGVREVRQAMGDSRSAELRQAADGTESSDLHRCAGAPMESARGVEHASGSGLEERRIHRHADGSDRALANANGHQWRSDIRESDACADGRHHPGWCRQVVPYPPGPGDRDGWSAYLDAYPNLAPAIESAVRRGADGTSTRVDRLRGLGNAVVPDQAEAALRCLWFRAFGEWP